MGAIALCVVLISKRTLSTIKKINECEYIAEIVQSINHGRVYPYFTGMSLRQVKKIVRESYVDTTEFDNYLQISELIGYVPGIDLPRTLNNHIDGVSMLLTRANTISSITIKIKNYAINKDAIMENMVGKFGKPTSVSKEFIIWKEGHMTIDIHLKNGTISVIDGNLLGR